ncbi:MAG: nucleotide exchange factor GrpE [Bacilli bacterium]
MENKEDVNLEETKVEETEEEVADEKSEIDIIKKQMLRMSADFENYKKRTSIEHEKNIKYANTKIVSELLPIIDNFERAIKFDNDDDLSDELSKFLEGFKMVYANFENILTNFGVKEIPTKDEEFNGNIHQAVMTESHEGIESGKVIEVFQKGYMFDGRVIRPAMVKISE